MRKMKDSGIEWIGEIPEDWEVIKAKNIGKFTSSGIDKKIVEGQKHVKIINYVDVYANKKHTLFEKDYMVVSATNSQIQNSLVKKGDMIFTPSSETKEDLGISSVIDSDLENTAFSYHVLRFRFFKEINHQFKKFLFNNNYIHSYFSYMSKGTIRQTLSRDDFNNIKILIPTSKDQEKIANYLDKKCEEIEDLIKIQELEIEKLEEYKKSVIYEAVTKGLNPNAKMKDSGIEWIGEIPEDWEIKKFKKIAKIITGNSIPDEEKENYTNRLDSYPYISTKDVYLDKNLINYENGMYTPINSTKFKLSPKNSTLLCIEGGSAGKKIAFSDKEVTFVNKLASIHSNEINNKYIYYFINSQRFKDQFNLKIDGLIGGVGITEIKEFLIVIPTKEETLKIVSYLDKKCEEIEELIKQKENKITKLEEYKKSLIYECVTGKREV